MIYGLVQNSVTITTGKENHAKAYRNTPAGRKGLVAEQPPEIVVEVMTVWGDIPTMPDDVPEEESTTPPTPTIEQRTAALESAILTMLGGVANV